MFALRLNENLQLLNAAVNIPLQKQNIIGLKACAVVEGINFNCAFVADKPNLAINFFSSAT